MVTIHPSITYKLDGAGWATCIIEDGEKRCEITASYLSDSLGNLVLAALSVLSGFKKVSFGFDEEPGEYRWIIGQTDLNVIKIEIRSFAELWGTKPDEDGELLFSTTCHPTLFATAVQRAAAVVLATHGENGYLEKWLEHPFPSRQFDLLTELTALCE